MSEGLSRRDRIEQLISQGCFSSDWSRVAIDESNDLRKIRNVWFRGDVSIGANAEIVNVPGGLSNVRIGDNVRIINVDRIECIPGATFGVGTDVCALDETGSRAVRIYPGLSAQVAVLAARMPEFASRKLTPLIDSHVKSLPDMPEIGDNAELLDCGVITDVRVWPGVRVEGARRLKNGSIVNNSTCGKPVAYVGHGVDAEIFIIEDGVVDGGSLLRNVYVGQGCVIDKGFTAHDSLFFANCSMECGEACAVLAGPYTVSMHKSSLLIGVQTSFFNAGSGTNMSNHMYKTGPVHWGVFERGVKTSSNAYVMHGSRIGAYSMVMGDHKNHPDSSEFPFSYLFGDAKGTTTLVPGAMLRSHGLRRDERKWPARDRRLGHGIPLHDRITFPVLNPLTLSLIKNSLELIKKLLDDGSYLSDNADIIYKNLRIARRHLFQAREFYGLCVESAASAADTAKYVDLAGQIVPLSLLEDIRKAGSIAEIERLLDQASASDSIPLPEIPGVDSSDPVTDYPL